MKLFREIFQDETKIVLVDEALIPDQSTYLIEEEKKEQKNRNVKNDTKHLTHLHHMEDLPIISGHEGATKAIEALYKTHQHLKGNKPSGYSISTKFDGSPSLVWGNHPKTKKFFVGTKSLFNKNPKINHTDADIDANHGHAPGLANKLKIALKHLKSTMPKSGGVFQGDVMYTGEDVRATGNNLSFAPNTLTYNVDKNGPEGKKILKSKMGIVPHTHYETDKNDDMKAVFNVNMRDFKDHPDVHMIDPQTKGPFNYSSKDQKAFGEAMKNVQAMHEKIVKSKSFEAIVGHEPLMLAYINSAIRNKQDNSTAGYIQYLSQQFAKKTDKVKSGASKEKLRKQLNDEIAEVAKKKKDFDQMFQFHKHFQSAKGALLNTLSKSSPYKETILGSPSKPEGFVVNHNGSPIKLVDRQGFSAANFDWNQRVNAGDNPTVLSFGRFNPPTVGHGKMMQVGSDIARRSGAQQLTVASRSHDPKKNPLSPSQKAQWLKSMFPGQNTAVAGEGQHTLVAQLQHLHNKGVKDITIVAGSDRVPEYQKILAKYNGDGDGKLWNFKRARVVSAGERDPDSEGVEGMSASKMRKAAKDSDFKTFKQGLPDHIKPDEAQEMFHTLKAEMGDVKIGPDTDGHALSIYTKRTDKLSKEAKTEIARRKRFGTWKGE